MGWKITKDTLSRTRCRQIDSPHKNNVASGKNARIRPSS
ncbi:hypothetical protein C4J84_3880 [Pseudomonas sp. R11-23-07]|nr:hypothetical protein C4J84_3880 [Pseudomonas sp. R11-23-07]